MKFCAVSIAENRAMEFFTGKVAMKAERAAMKAERAAMKAKRAAMRAERAAMKAFIEKSATKF